jgi:UDP-N-acetylmuramoyl-L-alanyl-D-glutamate--2,6-diaminopimelate ligase
MDYHKNIEEYANTKKKLFTGILANPIHPKMSLLPKDDEFGRKWSDELLFDKSLDYGINNNASLKAENINTRLDGTDFTIKYLAQDYPVSTKLTARFNIYNILTATGI